MAEPHRRLSVEEYLAFERGSEERHEYLDGEMFAMTGGSLRHNCIAANLVGILHPQLRGSGCRVVGSDMRIRVDATGLYTYPDVVVFCGKPRFADAHVDTLINPKVIFEVLSPSTEAYDRGRKFGHYRSVESLAELVLLAQDRIQMEHFIRQPDGKWLLEALDRPEGEIVLPSIGCTLPMTGVYEGVLDENP